MLTIFNESTTPWAMTSINERISKFTMNVELEEGKRKFMDVIVSNDVECVEDISGFVSMTTGSEVISNDNISVKFQNKDLKPMIVKSTNPNVSSDIILLTINLNGRIITGIEKKGNAAVLGHFIAKDMFIAAVSIKNTNDDSKFEFTLQKESTVYTYTFVKSVDGTYVLSIIETEVEEKIEKPSFVITHFRPSRPTNLIFVSERDLESLKSTYTRYDKHNVITFNTVESLEEAIEKVKATGYKAATLYNNKERERTKRDSMCFEKVKASFKSFNLLSNLGKVSFIK